MKRGNFETFIEATFRRGPLLKIKARFGFWGWLVMLSVFAVVVSWY